MVQQKLGAKPLLDVLRPQCSQQAARLAVTMNETMVRFLNLLRLATWNNDAIVSHRHLSMKGVQPVKMWILPTKL